jgi:phospholipid/cholesterol/gamma-HCH transport system permease protein
MAAPSRAEQPLLRFAGNVGRSVVRGLEFFGFGASIASQALSWLVLGRRRHQPVRSASIVARMMEVGVEALPIVSMLSLTIGVMLAIQGIDALASFGAQHQVAVGVSLSVTREFSPLITGILVAGRSGSALAARLGTMTISNEIDALRVMGINPVRFLVAPHLVAMVVMLPALVVWADFLSLLGAGLYITTDQGISVGAYFDQTVRYLDVGDVMHGLGKSVIFGVLITIVGVINGASVRGGAEGVGRATTNSVVQAITAIVVTDMLFVFVATR